MAHSINTRKTQDGKWIGSVDTKAYGAGYSLHTTVPFADRGEAYKAAEAWRTENAAKNKAKKAAKESAHMTCQCCGKGHLANTGKLAHHGYTRPGWGWQTASCIGAREMPFEVARDRLGQHIVNMTEQKARMIANRDGIELETIGFEVNYQGSEKDRKGRRIDVRVEVTRETWDAVKTQHDPLFSRYGRNRSFDEMKESELDGCNRQIKSISEYIEFQQARYDGWKPTHSGFDKATETWIKL